MEDDAALAEPPSRPLWVKVFGIVAAVLIVVLLVLVLSGGGHGPGRHLDGGSEGPPAEHSVPHP